VIRCADNGVGANLVLVAEQLRKIGKIAALKFLATFDWKL
jgi:hypothetical protein